MSSNSVRGQNFNQMKPYKAARPVKLHKRLGRTDRLINLMDSAATMGLHKFE
jgi:hypothetical protein